MENPSSLFIALTVLSAIAIVIGITYLTKIISSFLTKRLPIFKKTNEASVKLQNKWEGFLNGKHGWTFIGILTLASILFLLTSSTFNLIEWIVSIFNTFLIILTITLIKSLIEAIIVKKR